MYLLGQTAQDLIPHRAGVVDISYGLGVRLLDETGAEIALEEFEAEQTIHLVGNSPEGTVSTAIDEGDGAAEGHEDGGMRLEDFQAVLDRVALAPAGHSSLCGVIAGDLFGYDSLIGRFEIEVSPVL